MNDEVTDSVGPVHGQDRKTTNTPSAERKGYSWRAPGGDLLSQGVYPQVPLALTVLTSVFGMGTGVTLSLWPPENQLSRMRQPKPAALQGLQSKHERL
jgi:hypothetical protein